MGIHQRQAAFPHTFTHGGFALVALADMKRRGVDDGQQFRARFSGQPRRRLEPGVLADQQANLEATRLEHADALPGREIAPLVEHLVVGQFALGIGRHHITAAQHTGRVQAVLHRHAAGAPVAAGRMAHHHRQVFQCCQFIGHPFHGIMAGRNEGRAKEQVFGGVTTDRQLGGQHQTRALVVGGAGGVDDLLRVARKIAHHKIELGNTDFESHTGAEKRVKGQKRWRGIPGWQCTAAVRRGRRQLCHSGV
jgi:hypothetical protein